RHFARETQRKLQECVSGAAPDLTSVRLHTKNFGWLQVTNPESRVDRTNSPWQLVEKYRLQYSGRAIKISVVVSAS
ncbi:AAEL011430-PA, partial [Aedes aegypti]